jgi:hypothetical protein
MDVFRVRSDGAEELLASGLSSKEIAALREWFCYTKPLGHGVKIAVRSGPNSGSEFSVIASGHEPDAAENDFREHEFVR